MALVDDFGGGDARISGSGGISVPRGLFTRRNRIIQPKRRPVDDLLNSVEGDSDNLTSFKVIVPRFPTGLGVTSFPKNCTHCFPASRKKVSDKFLSLGIRNCLNVRTENKENKWYTRLFSQYAYFSKRHERAPEFRFIKPAEVLEDPRFLMGLKKHGNIATSATSVEISIDGDIFNDEKSRALKFLQEFGVQLSTNWLLRLINWVCGSGWLLSKLYCRIFEAICVHDGQLELLKSYHGVHPIIYVPLQRSHWDHFVLNWILLDADLKTPFVLAGRSLLNDPLMGKPAKRSGALGCLSRRKKTDKRSDIDISMGHSSVQVAFDLYLKKLLENSMSLEFSIESHRSRNGKPSTAFVGTEFIHLIASSISQGAIEDAYIVPVSITYEKLPDVDLLEKADSNLQRVHANFCKMTMPLLYSLWSLVTMKLGFVRVNLGHPISVREFQSVVMVTPKVDKLLEYTKKDESFWITEAYCIPSSSYALNWDSDNDSVTSLSSVYAETEIMEAPDRPTILIADILTSHIAYDAFVSTPLMSTDILAFILLTRYRESGASLERLIWDFEDIMYVILERKRDIGFSKTSDLKLVIERAVYLLGNHLVVRQELEGGHILLKPVLRRSSLVQLSYYSNHVLPMFALESIIAVVLFSLQSRNLTLFNNVGSTPVVYVKKEDVICKAKQLATLMKAEFLLHPPCLQLEEAIKITIDKMRDEYLITPEVKKIHHTDDDDDYYRDPRYFLERFEIRSIEEPSVYENLVNAKNLIVPYIQAYAEAFEILHELLPTDEIPEREMFESELRQKMLERVLHSPSVLSEVAIPDTIKNFIVSLHCLKIVNVFVESGRKIVMLTESYSNFTKLEIARNNILSFCTF